MFVTVKKNKKNTSSKLCLIPTKIFISLDLSENYLYHLNVGQLKESIHFKPHNESNNNLYFLETTFINLGLFSNIKLNIWKQGFYVFLGPVIGVLVNTKFLATFKSGNPPLFAQKHIQANKIGNCITYFFSINNINWFDNKIKGFTFAPKQNLLKEYWLPMPNIIYDRGVRFLSKQKKQVNFIRDKFRYNQSIHFINNQDFLGKWQLYKKLVQYPEVQQYLPETKRYKSFNDLQYMLAKHHYVFLKSFYGSRGQEVLSIKNKNNQYKLNFYKKELKTALIENMDSLKKFVDKFVGIKPFIIQQGIKKLKFKGRDMDIRILIEKDHQGQWKSIYNHARIAQKNFTITNCYTGASIENYDKIHSYLNLKGSHKYIPTDKKISEVTITIAKYIEKAFGSFGELGMDMAIDESGHIWFIESNTKPAKNPEPGLENTKEISPQFLSILEYSKFLAKELCIVSKKSLTIIFKQIKKDFPENNIISVPLSIFNNLNNCLNAKLKLGLLILDVICLPNFTSNTIEISPNLLESLGLLVKTTCNITAKNNILCLGPVIGVFASNGSIRRANEQNPDFRTLELFQANRDAHTILYFFSIKDVEFISKQIHGTHFNEETQLWEKKRFPLPDLLYDRGGGALKSQKKISDYIREQLNHDHIKKINSQHFFNKWDVYKKLLNYKELSSYLPLTILYKKPDDLNKMFKHSAILYIKDCLGSNGRGIIRVIKMPNHKYHYSYFAEEEVIEQKVTSFDNLIKVIENFLFKKKTIIQSAINVIKLNNSNIDMRATIQRNGLGKICITACSVRLARDKSPITSTKSGSNVYKIEDFFQNFFQYSQEETRKLKTDIDKFLLTSYKCIENSYGPFGEIGIDFAMDLDGQLWFIECNAKPGKDTLYLSYEENVIRKAFLNPLEYGKYITGF